MRLYIVAVPGPLAHRVEQGTFNPKVPGSSPGRPTSIEKSMTSDSSIPANEGIQIRRSIR